MVKMWKMGLAVPKSLLRSIRRWNKRLIPYQMTGNKACRGLSGHHRLLLALFKKIYPQASHSQCALFIACHSRDEAVYKDREISKALTDMNMTRKKASTTAYQAFTPENLELHHRFWQHPAPSGIKGTPRRRLVDIDECAIELKDANQNYGHAVKGARVRKVGNYGRGKKKITLIMAIEAGDPDLDPEEEGSTTNPRIWHRLSTDAGTSTENYVDFLKHDLFAFFKQDEPQRVIMHDNLSSHKSDEVVDAIYNSGHEVICRVPYRPHEAPIEWAFDMFACELRRRWNVIKDETDLVRECLSILESKAGMGGFDFLFEDCGYIWN